MIQEKLWHDYRWDEGIDILYNHPDKMADTKSLKWNWIEFTCPIISDRLADYCWKHNY